MSIALSIPPIITYDLFIVFATIHSFFVASYGPSTLSGNCDWIRGAVDACTAHNYPHIETYQDRSVNEMECRHAVLHGDNKT